MYLAQIVFKKNKQSHISDFFLSSSSSRPDQIPSQSANDQHPRLARHRLAAAPHHQLGHGGHQLGRSRPRRHRAVGLLRGRRGTPLGLPGVARLQEAQQGLLRL